MDLPNYINKFIPFTEPQFIAKLIEINDNTQWPDGTNNYCDPIIVDNIYYMIILSGFEHFFTQEQLNSAVDYNDDWRKQQ